MAEQEAPPPERDRRRRDRRSGFIRLADYTIPELRKALVTAVLLGVVLGLFLYMVHEVVVAIIFGVVLAIYLIPVHEWVQRRLRSRTVTAILVIVVVIVPLATILAYSWVEISGTARYLDENREAVAAEISAGIQRLPFGDRIEVRDDLPGLVSRIANRSTAVVEEVQETLDIVVLSIAVFLFTTFYVLTDHREIRDYIRSKTPGRYRPLANSITANVRQVAYGALYATFLTQIMKAAIVLGLNLIWDVPLAVVLAIAAFFIGFLPVVGSWSVYVPVSVYLMVFRDDVVGGALVLLIGGLVNTVFISLYLRPRIAARKSHILNFYWMFIALVTGVYTFGLVGIVIGPMLIATLKAVFETIAEAPVERLAGSEAQ